MDNSPPLDTSPLPLLLAIKRYSVVWRNLAVVRAVRSVVDMASSVANDRVGEDVVSGEDSG